MRPTLKIGIFVTVMFLCRSMAVAQLQETDTSRWQLNVSLSGKLNTGNIQRFIITPEINVTHIARNKKWGVALGERYTYGTFAKRRTENDVLSRNFLYLFPEKRIYPFVMLWMNTHKGQELRFRYQAGVGVTFVPLQKRKHTIKLSLTASYEQNWYNEAGIININDLSTSRYNTFRATFRLAGNHLFAKDLILLYYESYFQQSLQQRRNFRLFAEGGLNVKVFKGLGIKTFVSYEYQTAHLETEKDYDLIFNFGLNYRWSK